MRSPPWSQRKLVKSPPRDEWMRCEVRQLRENGRYTCGSLMLTWQKTWSTSSHCGSLQSSSADEDDTSGGTESSSSVPDSESQFFFQSLLLAFTHFSKALAAGVPSSAASHS